MLKRGAITLAAYMLAIVVGYAFFHEHVPLAWMLGPMLTSACLSIAGVNLYPSENLRRLGQLCIGVAVGLGLTAPVIAQLLLWFPLMVASALFSVFIAFFFGAFVARYARLDLRTAFYASMPGGLAEMANIGARSGAHPEPIALIQTLRISLIVLIMPPILIALGSPDFNPHVDEAISGQWALVLVTGGFAVSYLLKLVRLNNPFMIGAILFTALLVSNGVLSGRMHPWLFSAAQLLIGFTVGCRFRRSMLARMPRVTVAGMISILGMIAVTALWGYAISSGTGIGLPDALLATSPGGFSEMAATAQVLHLAVPLVAGFQVVRSVMVNAFASHYYGLAAKIGLLRLLGRLFGIKD